MKKHLVRFATAALALFMAVPAEGVRKQKTAAKPRVQNIILMVGDGMGLAQATSLMLAGGYVPINIERATVGGFVKTYSANNRVTDSAASATAYSTGEKTNNGYLGVDANGSPLETILEKAERAGMATGLVATTHIMHATPGAFYAHNRDRGKYEEIALDLLSSGVDVVIGGGGDYLAGRKDGRNLAEELREKGYVVTDDLAGLADVKCGNAMAVYPGGGQPLIKDGRDPSYLSDATSKALEILSINIVAHGAADTPRTKNIRAPRSANPGIGFFLMVEGSYIDSAGHANDAEMLLGEMRDFDAAVGVAFDYADTHPGTLVIVLADHETGGLSIPAGKENFLLPDSGIEFRWATGGHTGVMVPMFSYGTHASVFGGVMDNTAINHRMERLLGLE